MKDYYQTLGIEKTASKDDIKKAFRKLAHQYHPDKNKGNEAAGQKFKEASEAYSVLSDDQKRAQYDRFGSAGPGMGGGPGGFNGQGGPGFGGGAGFGGFDFSQFTQGGFGAQNGQSFEFDLNDIFSEFFGGGGGRGGRRARRGRNITIDLQLSFKESIFGTEREIAIGKEKFAVKIPPGIENGQILRVPEKGEEGQPGQNGEQAPRGELHVRIWVQPDKIFRKRREHLVTELHIKLSQALLGDTVTIHALDGALEVKVPQGTTNGEVLRVKGKGVPSEHGNAADHGGIFGGHGRRGDLLIVIHIDLPRKLSKNATRLVEELKKEGV